MTEPKVLQVRGTMRPTKAGRQLRGLKLYEKGLHFAAAGQLLQRHNGNGLVVHHLFCQALELLLKGLLIVKNDDVTKEELQNLGHKLGKLARRVRKEYGMRALSESAAAELKQLTREFSSHELRYGSIRDILMGTAIDPQNRLRRKVFAIARLAERHLPAVRASVE